MNQKQITAAVMAPSFTLADAVGLVIARGVGLDWSTSIIIVLVADALGAAMFLSRLREIRATRRDGLDRRRRRD